MPVVQPFMAAPPVPARSVVVENTPVMQTPVETVVEATNVTRQTELQRIEKELVVREHIHNLAKEEIQPIIHREREQTNVKQITQLLHETEVKPIIVQEEQLPAQVRPPLLMQSEVIESNTPLPSMTVDATMKSVENMEPIINETIRRIVVEEIQPVIEQDTVSVTILKQTLPVYLNTVYLDRERMAPRHMLSLKPNTQFSGGMLRDNRPYYVIEGNFDSESLKRSTSNSSLNEMMKRSTSNNSLNEMMKRSTSNSSLSDSLKRSTSNVGLNKMALSSA